MMLLAFRRSIRTRTAIIRPRKAPKVPANHQNNDVVEDFREKIPVTQESTSQTRLPYLLIPKDAKPIPRFPNSIFTDIETELRKPAHERNLPDSRHAKDIREFGATPDSKKIKSTKGKLKNSVRRAIDSYNEDNIEVEYLEPLKPRRKSGVDLEESSNNQPTQRQLRMSEIVRALISEVLVRDFSDNAVLNSTNVGITSVKVSRELSHCVVKWLPLNKDAVSVAECEEEFERAKKRIRWKVAGRLSYLRTSPELTFVYDKDVAQTEHALNILESQKIK